MSEENSQLTYKQHPIPQNVLGVEFKLVGELTLRQFLYVAVAGVIAYLLYSSSTPSFIRYPLSITVAIIGLAAAFLPVQNQSFDKWIIHFLAAVTSPTQRVWYKVPTPPDIFFFEYHPTAITTTTPMKDRARLTEYLRHLQQPVEEREMNELDRKELEFMRRLGLEPLKGPPPEGLPAARVPTYKAFEAVRKEPGKLNLASEISYAHSPIITMPSGSGYRAPITNTRVGRKLSAAALVESRIAPVKGEVTLAAPERSQFQTPDSSILIPSREEREEALKKQLEELNRRMEQLKKAKPPVRPPTYTAYEAAKSGSPLRTAPPAKPQPLKRPVPPAAPASSENQLREIDTRYGATLNTLQNRESQVSSQMKKAETDLDKMKLYAGEVSTKNVIYSQKLKEQETQLNQLAREKMAAEEKMKILQVELAKMRAQTSAGAALGQELRQRIAPPPAPPRPRVEPLVKDTPNVINGVVKEENGELVEGAVIIVKDENNEPVRALKTNGLGQFIIATPLPNGRYTVEASKEKEYFDIMTVDVTGVVLPPLEFVNQATV